MGGALGTISKAFRPSVIAALEDSYAQVRIEAARAIRTTACRSRKVIAALIERLQDDNPKVRAQVVRALGAVATADEKLERELLMLIEFDLSPDVVKEGLAAVLSLNLREPRMIQAIRERFERHESDELCEECRKTLAALNYNVETLQHKETLEDGVRSLVRALGTKESIVQRFTHEESVAIDGSELDLFQGPPVT